ncbi:CrpP-related protein [Achromobacter insolitus]|uniref:CrpP-related protein n=1 Tax=Achromobacter insolitus TaxID=217204 RepID=UPI0027E03FFC|nr:CrpP-related protein [Achromobacter insolitus]
MRWRRATASGVETLLRRPLNSLHTGPPFIYFWRSAEMHEDIRKQGALAARQGLTLWDCPYLKAQAMPGHTGESPAAWQAKVDAWEAGWMRERNLTRPPKRTTLSRERRV